MWFNALSWEEWMPLLLGTAILIILLLIRASRHRSQDLFYELGRPPTFFECWGTTLHSVYSHCGSCILGFIVFTCAWAYFTSCYDIWCAFCRFLGIPQLNVALVPVLFFVSCCFIRLIRFIGSTIRSEMQE